VAGAGVRQHRREALTAGLLGAGWILALFAPLLSPRRLLASRDVVVFHLPLRADLVRLATEGGSGWGVPWWNPWLHGGEPVLSNPNYAAFYPPTWLALLTSPHHALGLAVVFHAALAFAGAWLLVRRLGGGASAAALGAVGFTGGALLPLTHVYTALGGMAWLPWAALAADVAFSLPSSAPWRRVARPVAACALALALGLLAGEPAVNLLTALLVACLAVAHVARRRRATEERMDGRQRRRLATAMAARLAAIALLAALLAAVQLLPALHRVADSPRAGGLAVEQALDWSLHPARLAEVVFPHAFGDPARYASGRYFGWPLHDRGYGYLPTVHPGLLLTVLGVAALFTGVPRRTGWALAALVATLLACGRFTPLAPFLHAHLPGFAALRFPERFFSLTVAVLVFAGALGWQRWLRDGARAGRLPLALAAAALALALGGWAVVAAQPQRLAGWLAAAAPAPLSQAGTRAALDLLAAGALRAAALAVAVLALLLLARRRSASPASRRVVAVLAVALLAGDLWLHGHRLVRTLAAAELAAPPPLAAAVAPGSRLFADDAVVRQRELVRLGAGGEAELAPLRTQLARLDPYSGNLWRIPYALNDDFDLMLTAWGRRGLQALRTAWPDRGAVLRVTGAWDVGTLVLRRPLELRRAELAAGRPSPPLEVVHNPYRLPRLRFVDPVWFHGSVEEARAAVAAAGWDVAAADHWVGTPPPVQHDAEPSSPSAAEPRLTQRREGAAELTLGYRAAAPTHLVWAVTYDAGWRARLDGRPLRLYPTALGQMGAVLPAGEHRVHLAYRDSRVAWGAAVSLTTLLAVVALCAPALRRRGDRP